MTVSTSIKHGKNSSCLHFAVYTSLLEGLQTNYRTLWSTQLLLEWC